jgi:thiamine-phosphate pyrophosphorylase
MHTLRLIVVTEIKGFKTEIETIEKLCKAGLRTLHIRKPGYSRKKMKRFISSIPEKYHDRLVLHSHYGLAVRFKLKGIHFTETARQPAFWGWLKRRFFRNARPSLTISASYHSLSKVRKLWNIYDYIFLSPVFESISKKDNKIMPLHHGRIQDCLRLTKARVVALGGVDEKRVLACRDMGFYGVAVLGSIWQSPDPVSNFKEIQELCKATSPIA